MHGVEISVVIQIEKEKEQLREDLGHLLSQLLFFFFYLLHNFA